ncbi:MAG: class I SAM-dependent methyltransferase [Candidatus Thermoplasmatota archaeon]|nr:class I SAM-dependent methyltransferase [Candidatus Thermoplasmatota archaeon]
MKSAKTQMNSITDISETLLIPLYSRSFETQSKNPLIDDKKAVEITQKLNMVFADSDSLLHRQLAKGKVRRLSNKKLIAFLSLRTRRFDRYCQEFLTRFPQGVIVELGCGLSSRFSRIDNGTVTWYDLDFPEVIAIRTQFFQQTARNRMIASSVLDFSWMEQLVPKPEHVLFIAEGLVMYLFEAEVKSLVLELQQRFPGCELVCEVQNTFVINALQKERWKRKFQRDHHLGPDATMHFGIREGTDLQAWGSGIRLLDEWTVFDDHEKKLGWMNLFAFSKRLRKSQWVVHYQLQPPETA